MIIDADTHLTPFHEYGTDINADELVAMMDCAGVDKALSWARRPYDRCRLKEVVKYIYDSAKKYPDRIIGYGWVDPMLGMEYAMDTLRLCIEEYGFRGVKFNGCQSEHFSDDEKLVMPLLEYLAEKGATAAFHTGGDAPDQTSPYRIGKIAKQYPDMKILMVHIGCGGMSYDLSRQAIEVANECPNIYMVGSDIRTSSLLNVIKQLGTDRICFGSDAPFENMKVEVNRYRTLFEEELPREAYEGIMSGNILKFLE